MTCPSNLFLFSNHISRKKFASSTADRSEEHTSELQSLVISYAVFCLKKKKRSMETTVLSFYAQQRRCALLFVDIPHTVSGSSDQPHQRLRRPSRLYEDHRVNHSSSLAA